MKQRREQEARLCCVGRSREKAYCVSSDDHLLEIDVMLLCVSKALKMDAKVLAMGLHDSNTLVLLTDREMHVYNVRNNLNFKKKIEFAAPFHLPKVVFNTQNGQVRNFLVCSSPNHVSIVENKTFLRLEAFSDSKIVDLEIHPSENYLVLLAADCTLRFFDFSLQKIVLHFQVALNPLRVLSDPSGLLLFVLHCDALHTRINAYKITSGELLATIDPGSDVSDFYVDSETGDNIVIVNRDQSIELIDIQALSLAHSIPAPQAEKFWKQNKLFFPSYLLSGASPRDRQPAWKNGKENWGPQPSGVDRLKEPGKAQVSEGQASLRSQTIFFNKDIFSISENNQHIRDYLSSMGGRTERRELEGAERGRAEKAEWAVAWEREVIAPDPPDIDQ